MTVLHSSASGRPKVRTIARLRLWVAWCLAAALSAGCTNDPSQEDRLATYGILTERGLNLIGSGDAAPPGEQAVSAPAAVRGVLAQLPPGPVIRLELPESGQSAFAVFAATTGGHATFATFSRQTVTFRGGVVVATRGFAFDLMGADTGGVERAIARRTASRHDRVHRYLGPDEQEFSRAFACSLAPEGAERVTLVSGLSVATTRMRETCQSDVFTFNNIYWVAGDGAVVRTSQWISRELAEMHIDILRR